MAYKGEDDLDQLLDADEEFLLAEEDEEEGSEEEYNELAAKYSVPARDVTLPEEGKYRGGSITSSIEQLPDLSDTQSALLMLFPPDLGDRVRNKLMISRNPPESELAMIEMYANDKLMRSDPEGDVDFTEFIIEGSILTSIGRDGEGRIDGEELIGAAREAKQAETRLREMY